MQNVNVDLSNVTFADQVRAERLDIIWKSTLVTVTIVAWVFITVSGASGSFFQEGALLPWIVILFASLSCRFALQHDKLSIATWTYALGVLTAIASLLYATEEGSLARQIIPFLTIYVVYIVGLMLPPIAMFSYLPINTAVMVGVPWFADGGFSVPNGGTGVAFVMSLVTAFISVQASGELYAIAEWALDNYRRERTAANDLYDSRNQIQRSLNRQTALTTELANTNDELAQARRAAEEAKHFRGQFLANMSHELRTPLNAVIGFSETMLNFPPMYGGIELPDEYRRDLEQIHSSGRHLLNIINDILDLSKIDAGRLDIEIQEVELEPIIKSAMSTAVGLVGNKPVRLTRETPDIIPHVHGDPVRIRQIMLNIYSNAAKFTDEGYIKLILTHNDEFVTLSIQDTGIGISYEEQDKIFEEFRQGDAGRKKGRAGAGLGMTISRQLLELMGGRIWVESIPGEGSTFYFTLPIYTGATQPIIATELNTKVTA